jgi:allophanate hydrolase
MADPSSRTDIETLAAAYERGATVGEVIAEVHAEVDARDPVWISVATRAAVLARARALDELAPAARAALPLFGMPFAVKDNIDVAGMPTTAGCPAFAYLPERSATVVERLEHAGAVCLGKTNLDQFATGLVGTRSPYGIPVNPFDPAYIPGGSSSGSAVAVARGLVSFALGTDTAGSGRVPAGFTGTIGVKPTHGIVSAAGVVPACRSLDCVSIFARTLAGAAAILDAAAGPDPRDPFSRPRQTPGEQTARPSAGVDGPSAFTFAVPLPEQRVFFGDAQAAASFADALERLVALGGTPIEVDLTPCFATAALLYDGPYVAERTAAVGAFVDAHADAVLDVTRTIIQSGRRYSAVDTFTAIYELRALRVAALEMFARASVLVVPTSPTIYRLDEVAAEPYLYNSRLGTYTNFVNLLDLCALAVPSVPYPNGMPIGVTFIAPAFADAMLFDIARRFLPTISASGVC